MLGKAAERNRFFAVILPPVVFFRVMIRKLIHLLLIGVAKFTNKERENTTEKYVQL